MVIEKCKYDWQKINAQLIISVNFLENLTREKLIDVIQHQL